MIVREREDFLKWLSSYPFEEVHVRTFAKKHPGTGDWLLRRPEFDRWYTAQDSAVLWCYGKRQSVILLCCNIVANHE